MSGARPDGSRATQRPWHAAALALLCIVGSRSAQAHLRWFSERRQDGASWSWPLDALSVAVVLGALVFAIAVGALAATPAWRAVNLHFERVALRSRGMEWRVLAALTGVMWLVNGYMGVFVAPNLTPHLAPGGELALARLLQLAAGLALLLQPSLMLAGAMVVLTSLVMLLLVPLSLGIDYGLEFGALGAALVCVGPSISGLDRRLPGAATLQIGAAGRLAAPLVRIGVGATLVILSIHNKLLDPALGLEFLETHDFNFVRALGITRFSDLHFVLATGIAELTLGGLLLGGIGTRGVTLVLGGFFVTSFSLLGPVELVGHLPFFGIVLVLLLHGDGRRARAGVDGASHAPPGLGTD